MTQMKQVYNYSGTETWTPEPKVGIRESLFCVNFCPLRKVSAGVWLTIQKMFFSFPITQFFWINTGHPSTSKTPFFLFVCFFWFDYFLYSFWLKFNFSKCHRKALMLWPQIHLGAPEMYSHTYANSLQNGEIQASVCGHMGSACPVITKIIWFLNWITSLFSLSVWILSINTWVWLNACAVGACVLVCVRMCDSQHVGVFTTPFVLLLFIFTVCRY